MNATPQDEHESLALYNRMPVRGGLHIYQKLYVGEDALIYAEQTAEFHAADRGNMRQNG